MAKAAKRAGTRKRTWTRKEKKDRRNLKMWADGARESILQPHIAGYTDALERGWRAERDYVREVCREFHARISWRVADDEEPEEPLPEWDPQAIPEPEVLDDEETIAKRERIETMNAVGDCADSAVQKIQKRAMARDRSKDPWGLYLSKLAGVTSPPKARQAFQQYMHESYETDIKPVVEARWKASALEEDGVTLRTAKGPDAPFRAQVARELFKELSAAEQKALGDRAKKLAKDERDEYIAKMKAPVSKDPEDRQRCIDALGMFAQEFLKGVHEYTGLYSFCVFGGPVPSFDGDLRTLTVSWGRNIIEKLTFPQWAKERFGKEVLEFMRQWLITAFTEAECAEMVLPKGDAEDPLARAKYRMDDNWKGFGSQGSDSESEDDKSKSSDSDTDSETSDESGGSSSASDSASESSDGGETQSAVKRKDGRREKERKKVRAKANEKAKEEAKKRRAKGKGKEKEKTKEEKRKERKKELERRKDKDRQKEKAKGGREQEKKKEKEREKEKAKEKEKEREREKEKDKVKAKGKEREREGGSKRKAGEGGGAEDEARKKARTEDGRPQRKPTAKAKKGKATTAEGAASGSGSGSGGAGGNENGSGAPAPSRASSPPARAPSPPPPPPSPPPPAQPAPPGCPADAADWFKAVYAEVSTVPLGQPFNTLLEGWTNLERAYGWESGRRGLPSDGRPSQVSSWVSLARGSRGGSMGEGRGPTLADTVKFEKEWWGWWGKLQPEWRVRDEQREGRWARDERPATGPDTWTSLRFPGPNGILSLVACLFWWGKKLKSDERVGGWSEAVEDLSWMVWGMLAAEEAGKK
ncbi:hypothetical protein R3P38DRAFT_3190082 [Favolaschia claudopus]|uniref:Uncharacterized protein n=1 Tax=Favolaschia claudopus TaxID=2862362 RepID=A0AAW0BPM0_9AGAR